MIREFRERYRLTQLQLAYRLGVGPNTVSRWEREELPRSQMLELALKGLEVELSHTERQQG
jgi:transcriptional regulator with XRE-family HTH domain